MNKLETKLAIIAVALLMPTLASAAMYLKLDTIKGEARVAQCDAGACVFDGVAPGTYSVQVCDKKGQVIPSNMGLEYSVVSPRDIRSGQASGKRMHKPLTMTMSMDRSAKPGNQIAIDEAGVVLVIGVSGQALDAAQAKITKSRSNIQNN